MMIHSKLVRTALKLSALAALCAFGCLDAGTAEAGNSAQNLAVSATVANVCTIGTTPLAFGLYDGVVTNATTDLDVASKVTVTCTLAGADVTVTLGEGTNKDSTSTPAAPVRRLVDGASHFLTYSIFSNSGRTASWDNVAGIPTTPTGGAVDVPIYGRVDHGQSMPAGNYTDTVVATVSF